MPRDAAFPFAALGYLRFFSLLNRVKLHLAVNSKFLHGSAEPLKVADDLGGDDFHQRHISTLCRRR